MIYQLCNGDLTKRNWIEENMTVADAALVFAFNKFDAFVEEQNARKQK